MTPEQYLTDRVDDQLGYYEARSQYNQTWFRRLRVVEIVAAAMIPFLTGYADRSVTIQIIVGLLGVVIAVSAGMMGLYRYQENWTSYRATCEALRQRKILYNTQSPPYDIAEPFPIFLEDIESILSNEQQQWVARERTSRRPPGTPPSPGPSLPATTPPATAPPAAR